MTNIAKYHLFFFLILLLQAGNKLWKIYLIILCYNYEATCSKTEDKWAENSTMARSCTIFAFSINYFPLLSMEYWNSLSFYLSFMPLMEEMMIWSCLYHVVLFSDGYGNDGNAIDGIFWIKHLDKILDKIASFLLEVLEVFFFFLLLLVTLDCY